MLQALREKTSGLIAKILLGLIVITFSFFGIESYFVTQTDDFVAKVGDKKISQQDFRTRFDEFRQQQLQQANGAINASFFEQPAIKRRILDQMIDEQVILQANERLGVVIPADRLRSEILKIPAFLTDGKFDENLYRARLAAIGKTPVGFSNQVAEEIASRELPVEIAASAFVTDNQVDDYLRLRGQTRDFSYLNLAKPASPDSAVSDAEVKTFYDAHTQEFMNPEQVALEYLEIDGKTLDVQLVADEATLKDRYEKEKTRFVSSEQRLASHILVKIPGKGGPDEQKTALASAEAIVKSIREGKDFSELAQKDSADLGSKALGGDLGWIEKGMTDPAFENALYALEKDKVSDPVLSPEGYHVILVRDIRPGTTRSFEEVRSELAKEYSDTERERVFNEKSGRLIDMTYEDSTSLEPAARELGLTVQKTGLFSRSGGEGIASNPAVLSAAFSDSVLAQGNNSEKIELDPDHLVVVRVAEHKAATAKPMNEVAGEIRQRIIAERASKLAKDQADALFARLGKGESLKSLADELKLEVQHAHGTGRDAVNLDSALVTAAFAMPRPIADQPQSKLVDLGGDQFALLSLEVVADADPTSVDAKTREAAKTTLMQSQASSAARDFVAALRSAVEIKVVEDRM